MTQVEHKPIEVHEPFVDALRTALDWLANARETTRCALSTKGVRLIDTLAMPQGITAVGLVPIPYEAAPIVVFVGSYLFTPADDVALRSMIEAAGGVIANDWHAEVGSTTTGYQLRNEVGYMVTDALRRHVIMHREGLVNASLYERMTFPHGWGAALE